MIHVVVILAALTLSGCAAIPLGGAALGALSGGAGAAVNAGKEYAGNGVVYRTFAMPVRDLRLTVSDTLARMELAIVRDELDGPDQVIVAQARDREIKLELQPLTRTLTRMKVVVGAGMFRRDRATASEIVDQIELGAEAAVRKAARENGASRPARAAHRSRSPSASP